MKSQLFLVLALSFFLSCQNSKPAPETLVPSQSQKENDLMNPENYCHDQKVWEQWEDLVRKCPNDMDLQALHALRIGLCTKIEKGSIRLEDAIDIFDKAHNIVVEKTKRRSEGKEPST